MRSTCLHDWTTRPAFECSDCVRGVCESALVVARRISRTEEDAQDIASEAVLEIIERQRFDPQRGSFRTFLNRVVRTSAAGFYRSVGRLNRNVAAAGPLYVRTVIQNGVRYGVPHDQERALREAELTVMFGVMLDELPAADRHAFALHLRGYSRREIAERVLVDGRRLSQQRWSQRLIPIEDAAAAALQSIEE